MNGNERIARDSATAAPDVDDAVGMSESKWFIAIVNCRSEKSTAERLARLGVETYLPTQKELHVWKNGKKTMVDRVMIPSKVFIHCTEQKRRELVCLPYIFRFMTDRAKTSLNTIGNSIAFVPDGEIERLKFMLGATNEKVMFTERFVKGEKVRVVRGTLKGLDGEVIADAGSATNRLYVHIDFLGSVYVEIDPHDVEPIGRSKSH